MAERPTDEEFQDGAQQRGIAKSYEYVMAEAKRARASEAGKDAEIARLVNGWKDEAVTKDAQIKALADALEGILEHPGTKAALESLAPEAYEDAFALRADGRKALRAVGRL